MEKITLRVDGMSCEHCIKAITKTLGALPSVKKVQVNLGAKTVSAAFDPAACTLDKIKQEIEDLGYDVVA
ncbi:MAG: copper ion binding protein [Clostridiales bacterium]|nr:copper ion binding protein [Clostridiales bacterium]